MESIYFLIPLVLVFTLAAVLIYIWAVRSGQYDDLDRDAEQPLFDDVLDDTVDDVRGEQDKHEP